MARQAEASRSSFVPRGQEAQIRFLETLHLSARAYKDQFTRNWRTSAENYRGNNWDSRKEGNPFFKANIARAMLDQKAAKLTASKPICGVFPRRSGMTQTAKVLQRTDDALWDALDIQMRLEQMSAFVRPFGCGFFKTVWDPRASNALGDIICAEIDPRLIDLDPYCLRAYDIDRSLVIIHETSMPMTWVKQNFPRHANEVEDFTAPPPSPSDREIGSTQRNSTIGELKTPWTRYLASLRGGSGMSGTLSPIPYVRVRECWYADPQTQDGEALYPNGRGTYLIGSGRKAVIVNPEPEASSNPFWDGQWPFDMYNARGDIDHPWGSSQVDDLRRLEEAINRAGHNAVRNLVKNIPHWIADSGALGADYVKRIVDMGDALISKTPGLDVRLEPAINAIGDSVQLINLILQLMERQSGLSSGNPVSGRGRVEVRSPDLFWGLQQDNDIVNLEARHLESFLERVFRKVNSRIFQFYTTDRFIPYVTPSGIQAFQFEVKRLREEIHQIAFQAVSTKLISEQEENEDRRRRAKVVNFDTVKTAVHEALRGAWKEFDFKIVPLSSLASTRIARSRAMSQLAEEGAMPMGKVMEEAGFPNYEDLQQEAIDEKVKIGQMYMAAGLEPPQPDGKKKSSSKK